MMIVAVFFTVSNLSGDIPSDRGLWIFGILALKLAFRSKTVESPARDTAKSVHELAVKN
jgi:hypothetical protein